MLIDMPLTPAGVSKLSKLSFKKKVPFRVPLRELNEQEVYERDEAILGDLRRRRSGEHGVFEVDSVLVGPSPPVGQAGRSASTRLSSDTNSSNASRSTVATEVNDDKESSGKIRVLKRSDSEEHLRAKINAILENTTASKSPSSKATRRKFPQTKPSRLSPVKLQHPAIRQSSPSRSSHHSESLSSPEESFTGSPVSSPLRIRDPPASPLRVLRSPSPISRFAPPHVLRKGLGTKTTNTIPTGKKPTTGDKPKKVIIATNSVLPKRTVTKKPGNSTLRRAAGPLISAATSRLDEMRKMR